MDCYLAPLILLNGLDVSVCTSKTSVRLCVCVCVNVCNREKVTTRAILATVLIIVGNVIIVLFGYADGICPSHVRELFLLVLPLCPPSCFVLFLMGNVNTAPKRALHIHYSSSSTTLSGRRF